MGRTRKGIDCLGLFILLNLERKSVVIPDPYFSMGEAARVDILERYNPKYQKVENAIEGDAILMSVRGMPLHVGYCIDRNYMLHTEDEAGSIIEKWNGSKMGQRIIGAYRYVGNL